MSQIYVITTPRNKIRSRLEKLGVVVGSYEEKRWLARSWQAGDKLVLRWDTVEVNQRWFELARELVAKAKSVGVKVVDEWFWGSLPKFRDKYVQAQVYRSKGINHVETERLDEWWQDRKITYPILIKKRLGGKGLGSLVVEKEEELVAKAGELVQEAYIVQPYRKLARDLRVVIIGGKVIGVVRRAVKIKRDSSVGVKVVEEVELNSKEKAVLETYLRELKPEVCGLDILTDESGYSWVAEGNYSPLFSGFERITGKDFLEILVRWLNG